MGVLASALLGALTHLLVMRQLRRASPLAKIVATLGVLILLQGFAVIRYGARVTFVESELPTTLVHPFGQAVSVDRFILLGIAAVLSVVLCGALPVHEVRPGDDGGRREPAGRGDGRASRPTGSPSSTGRSAPASPASPPSSSSPIVTLQVSTMTNLVLAAMAAALVASFRSFPIAFVAGVAIGVGQIELTRYVSTPGVSSSLPFAVIILVMIFRGQALPVRGYFLQKLPGVGTGRVKLWQVAVGVALAVGLTAVVPTNWQDSIVTTFAIAIILLSIVVVTGYAGQLSLGQFALAGFGAWVAGRLVDVWGWPFFLALLVGPSPRCRSARCSPSRRCAPAA